MQPMVRRPLLSWVPINLGYALRDEQQVVKAHIWKGQDARWFGARPGYDGFLGPFADAQAAKAAMKDLVHG